MSEDTGRKVDIDWVTTLSGALAAVSSAVLLSTLGAAGTIIGAALGSVTLTVGGAFYRHGLTRSRARLAQGQAAARHKVAVAQAEVRRASRRRGSDPRVEAHLSHAEGRLDEAQQDLESDPTQVPNRRERLLTLPWKRISLGAAGVFAVSLLAITAFELVAGQSVSSMTGGSDGSGGTTLSRIGGGGSDRDETRDRDEDPLEDDASSPTEPSDGSSPTEPTGPSTEPAESTDPTDPTESPSESTSPSPSPTELSTPAPSQPVEPTTTSPSE